MYYEAEKFPIMYSTPEMDLKEKVTISNMTLDEFDPLIGAI
jgi:hypothetical protein